jgi:hypothetical protein
LKLLRTWIDRKLDEIAGIEDEVVTNFVISELENADEKGPDPKRLQINLEGNSSSKQASSIREPDLSLQNSGRC